MRMQRLAGWWRLWIVLTVIYGGLVSGFTWMTWPKAELRGALLWWLVPSILICILGLAVAWVIRGFTGGRVQG